MTEVQERPATRLEYKVEEAWETNLEPGFWYRIVDAERPRIICGSVFEPKRGPVDYRDVTGKSLSPRMTGYQEVIQAWDAAIRVFKGEDA